MIVDTDVLVWDLRGNEAAREALKAAAPFDISVVTYAELLHGMRDRRELDSLPRQLRRWGANIYQVDQRISARAMFYVEGYFLSHSTYFADAMIAATAIESGKALFTANTKHYRHIDGIRLEQFSPHPEQ